MIALLKTNCFWLPVVLVAALYPCLLHATHETPAPLACDAEWAAILPKTVSKQATPEVLEPKVPKVPKVTTPWLMRDDKTIDKVIWALFQHNIPISHFYLTYAATPEVDDLVKEITNHRFSSARSFFGVLKMSARHTKFLLLRNGIYRQYFQFPPSFNTDKRVLLRSLRLLSQRGVDTHGSNILKFFPTGELARELETLFGAPVDGRMMWRLGHYFGPNWSTLVVQSETWVRIEDPTLSGAYYVADPTLPPVDQMLFDVVRCIKQTLKAIKRVDAAYAAMSEQLRQHISKEDFIDFLERYSISF